MTTVMMILHAMFEFSFDVDAVMWQIFVTLGHFRFSLWPAMNAEYRVLLVLFQ